MHKPFYSMLALLILSLPLTTSADTGTSKKPMVYAVLMYADWCGSCKALDPKITQARVNGGLDAKNVLFVTFDLTDETTSHQAAMLADVMGIAELYESNAGKTGYMVLVNPEDGAPISKITKSLDAESISQQITEAIDSANS